MKLVGFGCSFTYGSELIDPELDSVWDDTSESHIWDRHYKNNSWRKSHCWLGLLAEYFNCEYDNRAEPANSNFAIQHQVADYILNIYDPNDNIVICVGWTEKLRMSWYDTKWTHNGFVSEKTGWNNSAREWVIRSKSETHNMYTNNAKLFVNSLCKFYNIPILQFNALGNHATSKYSNYFIDGNTMDSMLKQAQQNDSRLNLFASGGHPNEAGHEYFTIRLHDFAKQRII